MEWESYWNNLIEKKKLRPRLDELDELDKARCNPYTTEQICHKIYDDYYRIWRPKWKQVRDHFWELVEQFQGVHLQTSRIKTLDSLLVKVICKRHEHLGDPDSLYFKIDGENYREIITDLIGMRLIINYRGKWEMIHNEIVQHFPYVEEKLYDEYDLIPMDKLDKNALVQIPTIYYAQGDNIEPYRKYHIVPKLHNMGYRSIHYTVCFESVYIEIQVRTIYDEAWSDCDHNYVYMQDENKSHSALEQVSQILCQMTNISNDLGEHMRQIFEGETIIDQHDGTWKTSQEGLDIFDNALDRIGKTYEQLESFRKKLKA